jgi:hypothetical protein
MAEKTIEEYAVDLVVDGATSFAEDDMNEDGEVADENHQDACDLALEIAKAIRDNPQAVLALVARAHHAGLMGAAAPDPALPA